MLGKPVGIGGGFSYQIKDMRSIWQNLNAMCLISTKYLDPI